MSTRLLWAVRDGTQTRGSTCPHRQGDLTLGDTGWYFRALSCPSPCASVTHRLIERWTVFPPHPLDMRHSEEGGLPEALAGLFLTSHWPLYSHMLLPEPITAKGEGRPTGRVAGCETGTLP
jgi:hypothetical protein